MFGEGYKLVKLVNLNHYLALFCMEREACVCMDKLMEEGNAYYKC
jgi:hypothetical protein